MRCEETREALEEARTKEPCGLAREHLASCTACQAYAREWRLVGMGFRALAEERVPEPSVGFAARVVRRLEEATQPASFGEEFVELAGRRVVFACLLLALAFLMALVLPSSGPLRGPATADVSWAQAEVTAGENNPIFADDFSRKHSAVETVLSHEGDMGR